VVEYLKIFKTATQVLSGSKYPTISFVLLFGIDLLSKHVHFTGTGDKEIQLFRCLSIAHDDVLAWWKSQKDFYPRLSLLAKIILSVAHPNEFFPQRD